MGTVFYVSDGGLGLPEYYESMIYNQVFFDKFPRDWIWTSDFERRAEVHASEIEATKQHGTKFRITGVEITCLESPFQSLHIDWLIGESPLITVKSNYPSQYDELVRE